MVLWTNKCGHHETLYGAVETFLTHPSKDWKKEVHCPMGCKLTVRGCP